MKALVLKELKERIPILVVGLVTAIIPGLAALIYSLGGASPQMLHNVAFAVTAVEYLIISVFFTMFIVSSAIAGEVERKNISFLLSLPFSRARLWTAKFLSSLFCMLLIMGVFLALNMSHMELSRQPSATVEKVLLFCLPFLMLSIAFFASSISEREASSNGMAFLILVLTLLSLGASSFYFEWLYHPSTLLIVLVCWMLFFLLTSLVICLKSDFLDLRKKALFSLKASVASLAILCAVQVLFCHYSLHNPPGDCAAEHVIAGPDGSLLFNVTFETPSLSTKGIRTNRLWLMAGKSSGIKKFSQNGIGDFRFTPGGEIDFYRLRMPQILGIVLGKEADMELWRMDGKGEHTRRLYSFHGGDYGRCEVRVVYVNNKTVLLMHEAGTCGARLVVLSPSGMVEKEIEIGTDSGLQWFSMVYLNGRVYIQDEEYRLDRGIMAFRNTTLYRFNVDTFSLEKLYRIEGTSSEPFCHPGLISSDGSCQLIKRIYRKNGKHQKDEIWLKRLEGEGKEELLYSVPWRIRHIFWLQGGKRWAFISSAETENRVRIVSFDLESRKEKVLFEKADAVIPGGDVFTIDASGTMERGVYYFQHHYPIPRKIAFLLHEMSKSAMERIILLDLDRGTSQVLAEASNLCRNFAISPDLTQLALVTSSVSDRAARTNARCTTASLSIRDLSAGRDRSVMELPPSDMRGNYVHGLSLIWRDSGELVVVSKPFGVYSVTERGALVRKVAP